MIRTGNPGQHIVIPLMLTNVAQIESIEAERGILVGRKFSLTLAKTLAYQV